MLLGHGTISEFAIGSVRGGGVQNVGSPFISGVSFGASVTDLESVTGAATFAVNFSVGTPNFFIWNEVDDSQTVTWIDVEPGSTD